MKWTFSDLEQHLIQRVLADFAYFLDQREVLFRVIEEFGFANGLRLISRMSASGCRIVMRYTRAAHTFFSVICIAATVIF
jgi:hypothetical protein